MKIPSADIPQADILDEVVNTIRAVSDGARSYGDVARNIHKVERQGRYYRRAGEILGFLRNEHRHNRVTLTDMGQRFINNPREREQLLASAVLNSRVFQRIVPFLEAAGNDGVSRNDLERFIVNVTEPVGKTMVSRRLSTITNWMKRISMLQEDGSRYTLSRKLPSGIEIVHYEAIDEPLSPTKYDLAEYKSVAERARNAQGYIATQIDAAALERADLTHQMLINCVASRIRSIGAIPKQNRYIDLSATINNIHYFFEMKSTTDTNAHSQIRKAISQLYEYRYIQQAPDARLVVVIENPVLKDKRWLIDYVVNDRQLLIAWDGDRTNLHCPERLRDEMSFLVQA